MKTIAKEDFGTPHSAVAPGIGGSYNRVDTRYASVAGEGLKHTTGRLLVDLTFTTAEVNGLWMANCNEEHIIAQGNSEDEAIMRCQISALAVVSDRITNLLEMSL